MGVFLIVHPVKVYLVGIRTVSDHQTGYIERVLYACVDQRSIVKIVPRFDVSTVFNQLPCNVD